MEKLHENSDTFMAKRFRGFLPVVIDVETGGFDCQKNALLEVAAVILEMNSQGKLQIKESLSKNDVKTVSQGRSTILPNGDLFVEEQNYGRILYFNSDGSLRWTHINRAENGNLYANSWSRILFDKKDIKIVNNFLQAEAKCDK